MSDTIQGTIVSSGSGGLLAGYRIFVFPDNKVSVEHLIGQGTTDAKGQFEVTYGNTPDVAKMRDSFPTQGPDLVLQVFDPKNRLVHETPPRQGTARFETYRITLDASSPSDTIQGSVVDAQRKSPLSNHLVQAFSVDHPEEKDILGTGSTDDQGRFRIAYRRTVLVTKVRKAFLTGGPGLRLVVIDPAGKRALATEPLQRKDRFKPHVLTIQTRSTTKFIQLQPALAKAGIRDSFTLRQLAKEPQALRKLNLDDPTIETVTVFANLSRVFPPDVALAFQDSGVENISSLQTMSGTELEAILVEAELPGDQITMQMARLERVQRALQQGADPKLLTGISLDLGPGAGLSQEDHKKLHTMGVETLADWAVGRNQAPLSAEGSEILDQYARLAAIGFLGEQSEHLIQARITSAFDLANITPSQAASIANQLGIPAQAFDAAIVRALHQWRAILDLWNDLRIHGNGRWPEWFDPFDDLVIRKPVCLECPEALSAFSCFAYFVYLVQLSGLTFGELDRQIPLDLRSLSPSNGKEVVSDPEVACDTLTRCDLAVRAVQKHLDQRRLQADSGDEGQRYAYLTFEAWRAERMGELYPELSALWRDDVLTGEDVTWDRGSIIYNRAVTRPILQEQLTAARDALERVRIERSDEAFFFQISQERFDALQPFAQSNPAFFADFSDGFSVIEDILAADDKVQAALVELDQNQPGKALNALNEADAALDRMAGKVFFEDAAWNRLGRDAARPYDAVIKLAPKPRRALLETLAEELFQGPKKLFSPRNQEIQIIGLQDSGEINGSNGWRRSGAIQEINGQVVKFRSTSTARFTYIGDDSLDVFQALNNYMIIVDFQLQEQLKPDQFFGIGIYIQPAEQALPQGYEVRIRTKFEVDDGETSVFEYLQLIKRVERSDGTLGAEHLTQDRLVDAAGQVNSKEEERLLRTDRRYTLSIRVTGKTIHGQLSGKGPSPITIAATDETFEAGTFNLLASSLTRITFSQLRFEIEGASGGYPPFFAQRRADQPHQIDRALYDDHIAAGRGMAIPDAAEVALTYTSSRITTDFLRGVTEIGTNDILLHLVFPAGQPAFVPNALDALLEKLLAASFYLRFVVIPVRMAQVHLYSGDYARAGDLLRIVYDDALPAEADREIYPALSAAPQTFVQTAGADARLMRLRLAEAYLAHAEWLFRQDTRQSRYEARRLYESVLALHDDVNFCSCDSALGTISEIVDIVNVLAPLPSNPVADKITGSIAELFRERGLPIDFGGLARDLPVRSGEISVDTLITGLENVRARLKNEVTSYHQRVDAKATLDGMEKKAAALVREAELQGGPLLSPDPLKAAAPAVPDRGRQFSRRGRTPFNKFKHFEGFPDIFVTIEHTFCVPPAPLKTQQKEQACQMLRLLRDCRNILGFTDDLVPPLRFDALIRLARYLTDQAHAAERDLLNFRQSFEQESFSLFQAQNNLILSNADVDLEILSTEQAQGDILLAELQLGQAQNNANHFQQLISDGLIEAEKLALGSAVTSAVLSGVAALPALASAGLAAFGLAQMGTGVFASTGTIATAAGLLGTVTSGPQALAALADSISRAASMQASFERREQEWQHSLQQSQFDVQIGRQQVVQAGRRLAIALQRQNIAGLRRDIANDTVQFLGAKFLSAAMWLALQRAIRDQYRTRLNYAVTASFMAERALAFELQNKSLDVIRFDYFDPQRDGLLGATQLQTDLATLESTRLAFTRRQLQLSKTFSLAQLMPAEFQQFKNGAGRLPFTTLLEWFDDEFPGHYMRLIKSVKVTVLALVPPINGIRATLKHIGLSRVVVGPPYATEFETIEIRHSPQAIALTAPFRDDGLFVLDYRGDLLLPFEGSGVETSWAFEMPKAANAFDFNTVADILLEIEYTALASDVYRRAVIARRDSKFSADRAFSLRFNFPDAWYHLNNPGPDTARLETTFETARVDFPPNLEDDSLVIEHMAVLIDTQGMEDATPVDLQLGLASTRKPAGGKPETISGAATVRLGGLSAPGKSLISTQPKSAGVRPDAAWFDMLGTSPIASWTLRIENAPKLRKIFEAGHVEDILLILTVRGRTPSFP